MKRRDVCEWISLPTRGWWGVDDLGVLSSPLQSLPVLIAWGRCVRFVEFPDLFTPDRCLREAGAGGSNPLTRTIPDDINSHSVPLRVPITRPV